MACAAKAARTYRPIVGGSILPAHAIYLAREAV
jgi:hypothetical protein